MLRSRERKEKERLNREIARLNADLSNMAERVHEAEQKQSFAEKEAEKKQEDHARKDVNAWSSQVGEEGGCERRFDRMCCTLIKW